MNSTDTRATIERVADKRHANLMALGWNEQDAAQAVVGYLNRLRLEWPHSQRVKEYIDSLISGYSVQL